MMLFSVVLPACLLALCNQVFHSSAAELSVMAEREVEILSASEVYPYVVLSCNILPANESVRSRWILPNGQILAKSDERFLISIGATDFGRSSILVIPNLSYKDTGFYTCEAMRTGGKISSHVCDGFPVSSSIELLLEASIVSLMSDVNATVGTSASLGCEMKGYIRADDDIQWFKKDRRIYDGMYTHFFITFTDGTPNSAQSGSYRTVPSRISVLKISSVTVSDSGVYSCKLQGHRVQSYISLNVMKSLTFKPTSGTHELLGQDDSSRFNATGNESIKPSSSLNGCRAELSRVVAITFGCSFLVAAIFSVIFTSVVISLCYKLNIAKAKLTTKSETVHTEQASHTHQNCQREISSSVSTNATIG